MSEAKIKIVEDLPGVGPAIAEKLREAGYDTLEAVGTQAPGTLSDATGIGKESCAKFVNEARKAANTGMKGTNGRFLANREDDKSRRLALAHMNAKTAKLEKNNNIPHNPNANAKFDNKSMPGMSNMQSTSRHTQQSKETLKELPLTATKIVAPQISWCSYYMRQAQIMYF